MKLQVLLEKDDGYILKSLNEGNREFVMEYLALLEVPSTKSAVLLEEQVKKS